MKGVATKNFVATLAAIGQLAKAAAIDALSIVMPNRGEARYVRPKMYIPPERMPPVIRFAMERVMGICQL